MLKYIIIVLLFSFALISQELPKINETGKTERIIPGSLYEAGGFHRFWFGNTWRDLWTTEIEVPVLDFDTYAGGLTLIKRGGGQQTRSLKFLGADGKVYKFRSIRKFTDVFLPDELKNTVVDYISIDMFSTINPVSAIVSAPFANYVGVLDAEPQLCILPHDDRLEEYYDDFAGLLGTIEEHPDEYDEDNISNFGDADKIFGTYKLYQRWNDDNEYQIDQREYLKARLLDIYLGDWDRHYDQWRWAKYEINDEHKRMVPIPRDRDQSFSRYNGVFYSILEFFIPQAEHYNENYPSMEDLTWSGRYLDRKFLSELDKKTFDSVANDFISQITLERIDSALLRMPREMYDKEAANLRKVMIKRKDNFRDAANEFYALISKEVDIWASNDNEYVDIKRLNDRYTDVRIYDRDKDNPGEKIGYPFYHRVFDHTETDEIRIMMFGGEDKVKLTGDVNEGIKIYIVGGKDKDEFEDRSTVKGNWWKFLPFENEYSRKTIFMDHGNGSDFTTGPSTKIDNHKYDKPENDTALFEPKIRDWKYDIGASPWFSINSDEGFLVGGGPVYNNYGFRKEPFEYSMRFRIGVSTRLDGFKTDYKLQIPKLWRPFDFNFRAYVSNIDNARFFGIGNETPNTEDDEYYRANFFNMYLKPYISYEIFEDFEVDLGLSLRNINYAGVDEETFLSEIDIYGKNDFTLLTFFSNINYDSRNSTYNPKSGLLADLELNFTPKLFNLREEYSKISFDTRYYFSDHYLTDYTVAARIGLQHVIGNPPFFELPDIGGSSKLRGYRTQRFIGQTAFWTGIENRIKISDIALIVPGKFGGLIYTETGRVFLENDNSKLWHSAVGFGLWTSIYRDDFLLSGSVALSKEVPSYYINIGFDF